ncbi:hypothetical protein [uncultured Dysosmobacter sp.]|uniref:hypothetical protein n=1 Tax=uncultured Dysosmobacter sp. TaxID=2591384 RepID=UPI0026169973|nr:hypothetical protein [uncultured Dysosmobacter sp.]
MSDYKKYYGGKILRNSLIKTIPKMCLGAVLFARIIHRKENTHYLFCPPTLGDSILAFSYLSEFKRQRNISHVTVVCTPNYVQRLCNYFPDAVDDVFCMKKWKLGALREFVGSKLGQYYSCLYIDRMTFVFLTCNAHLRTLWDNPVISYPLYAKAMLYKISLASQPKRPKIPEADISDYISKFKLKKGRTVLLNPKANTVCCDVLKLLEATVMELTARGYTVVTLTENDLERPIRGTQAIPCNLEEAFSLVSYGGILIGLRSGFMDVMVYANCKIITIDDKDYGFKSFFSLERLGVNPDCHTITYDGNNDAAIREIIQILM